MSRAPVEAGTFHLLNFFKVADACGATTRTTTRFAALPHTKADACRLHKGHAGNDRGRRYAAAIVARFVKDNISPEGSIILQSVHASINRPELHDR
jgi:hypothetical protein